MTDHPPIAPPQGAAPQALADGAVLFREGQMSDLAYVLASGQVELTKATPQGPVTLAVLGEGEIFGEMGLLDGSVRTATATARGAVVLHAYDREQFYALLAEPETALGMLRRVVRRLRQADEMVARRRPRPEDTGLKALLKRWLGEGNHADSVVRAFQPDAVEIEERPVPAAAKGVLYAVAAFMVAAVVWASVATLDRVVVVPGTVVAVGPTSVAVEARLPAHDRGAVRPGAPVRVVVDGVVTDGHVAAIAPAPPFAGRIEIATWIPNSDMLVPGMVAECRITVGTRRVIAYFLAPVARTLDTALRER